MDWHSYLQMDPIYAMYVLYFGSVPRKVAKSAEDSDEPSLKNNCYISNIKWQIAPSESSKLAALE